MENEYSDFAKQETAEEMNGQYTETYSEQSVPKSAVKHTGKSGGFGVKVTALVLSAAVLGGAAGGGLTAKLLENKYRASEPSSSQLQYSNTVAEAENTTNTQPASEQVSDAAAAETGSAGESALTVYEGNRQQAVLTVEQVNTGTQLTAAQVYAANVASTVGIQTEVTTTNYWGYETTAAAKGSGFIISSNGYILTNYHVIEGAKTVTVATYDDKSYEAEIIGYDSSNDIAVLKIDAEDLVPVTLGNSDDLYVGDSVIAIGNPLGELTFSLTAGYVSALNREVTLSSSVTMKLIQTDCAINSGNSGGALFNMYGEVVGITNAKISSGGSSSSASVDNIGFAIPINTARSIVYDIIEKGYFTRPYIGVTVSTVSRNVAAYGIPYGASVQSVEEGSPAEQAGLQANDVITAVNGNSISSSSELVAVVRKCEVGESLTLSVYRAGQELTITLTIGETQVSALEEEEETTAQPENNGSYNGFGMPGNGGYGGNGSNGSNGSSGSNG